jgi:hypothetical protein
MSVPATPANPHDYAQNRIVGPSHVDGRALLAADSVSTALVADSLRPRSPGSAEKHAADEGAPGDWTNDAVDVDPDSLLEGADGCVRAWAEDAVDLEAAVRIAGEVARLELLLDATHRLTCAAAADGDDQRLPGVRADDAVDRKPTTRLEAAYRRLCTRTEDPVDDDILVMRAQQVLKRRHGMVLSATPEDRPRQDETTHTDPIPSIKRADTS